MTQKTGREQAHRKVENSKDAKQPHSNFYLRSPKDKTLLKVLSRSHKNWTFNRRISG